MTFQTLYISSHCNFNRLIKFRSISGHDQIRLFWQTTDKGQNRRVNRTLTNQLFEITPTSFTPAIQVIYFSLYIELALLSPISVASDEMSFGFACVIGYIAHVIWRTYSSLKKCSFFALLIGITGVHLFSSGLPFETTSLCNLNKCSKVEFPRKISFRAIEHARSSIRFLSWNLFWKVVSWNNRL